MKPPAYPYEWDMHRGFATLAKTVAFARVHSPYLGTTAAGLVDADLVADLDSEIAKNVARVPALKARYAAGLERQRKFDGLRQAGKKLPLAEIDNAFLRRYYKEKGLGE